jgi:protein NirF
MFCVVQPGGRYVWINFAPPRNDTVQIIDMLHGQIADELRPGPGVLHMEFTSKGREVWISVRDADRVDIIDTASRAKIAELPAVKPSGIFFTARANRIGL